MQEAIGLLRLFLEKELAITQIDEVEVDDISAWFAHLRTTPGATGCAGYFAHPFAKEGG